MTGQMSPEHAPDGTGREPVEMNDEQGQPIGHGLPALPDDEPIANPGLPEHAWRPTDVDEVGSAVTDAIAWMSTMRTL